MTRIGIPHLRAHANDLVEHCGIELGAADLVQHPRRRRHHPPRQLVVVVLGVVLARGTRRQALLPHEVAEVLVRLGEGRRVEPVLVSLRFQIPERRLHGRLGRSAPGRPDRRVEHVEAGPEALDVDERREPDRAVAVQLDRAPRRDEVRCELAHGVGREQAAGILEVEAVDVRAVRECSDALGVVRVRVHRADRVRQPDDDLLDALLARHPRGATKRLRIVGRLGELEATDAVADDAPERQPHHLFVARLPRDEAHAGRDEVEERARHRGAHQPDQLPRVLAMEAHGDRHVRARREVQRVEADALHRRRDREDVARRQARGAPEALVAVAGRRVDDPTTERLTAPPGRAASRTPRARRSRRRPRRSCRRCPRARSSSSSSPR